MPIKLDDGFMSLEIDGKILAIAREARWRLREVRLLSEVLQPEPGHRSSNRYHSPGGYSRQ